MVTDVRQFPLPKTRATRPNSRFLWGAENRLVDVLLTKLFSHRKEDWNCFLLHGSSGTGKSLLLHNLVEAWEYSYGDGALLTTASDFAHELNRASKANQTTVWRHEQRRAAFWLMDDVESLSRFPLAQRELCLLLDDFQIAEVPVVMTTRVAPSASQLEAALLSRLVGRHTIPLVTPAVSTRLKFIEGLLKRQRYSIDRASVHWLAENLNGSFFDIQNQIAARLSELDGELSKSAVMKLFQDASLSPDKQIQQLCQIVAGVFGVTQAELKSASRRQAIVRARNAVCHVARETCQISFYEIAKHLGNRDHSTIIHACKQAGKKIEQESEFAELIGEVIQVHKRRSSRTSIFNGNSG